MQIPKRKSENNVYIKKDPHLTQEKFNELKVRLEKLKKRCPELAAEVKRLAKMGDFSENYAYQMAKGKLRGVNRKILETEDWIKRAIIIVPDKNTGRIELGSRVVIKNSGNQKIYKILGSQETNPSKGVISHNSPLGSALIGRKEGDKIEIELNDKKVEYEIIKID